MVPNLTRFLTPLNLAIRRTVARGIVLSMIDTTKVATAQVRLLDDQLQDGVEVLNQYGFSSVPAGQAECLCFAVGGDSNHRIMVAVCDRKNRFKALLPGEAVVYDNQGQKIHLRRSGLEIITTKPITVNGQSLEVTATAKVKVATADYQVESPTVKFTTANAVFTGQLTAANIAAGSITAAPAAGSPAGAVADVSDSEGTLRALRARVTALESAFNAHTHVANGNGSATSTPNRTV
ncbi:MAG: phage baseplate assembly protein V [Candidatus Pacebacteria bacterium]|nr:phage baseplate assembly protein V [Candidatus Paceibacterota bacterium]